MSTPETLKHIKDRIIGVKRGKTGKKYIVYFEITEKTLEKIAQHEKGETVDEKLEDIVQQAQGNEEKIRELVRKIIAEMGITQTAPTPLKPRKPETEKPKLELGELREVRENEKKRNKRRR